MYPTALQQPFQSQVIPIKSQPGVLTHVELNYHDVKCIELACIGLAECLRNNALPNNLAHFGAGHLIAQLNYLRDWIHKPALKSQLRADGSNVVFWPCTSTELVDWLLNIIQSCVSEDAILIAAADAASGRYAEFSNFYSENNNSYSLADEMMYCRFRGLWDYYNDIITSCHATLVRKLALIRVQGYPLFPKYPVFN